MQRLFPLFYVFICLLAARPLSAEPPWGKDASLLDKECNTLSSASSPLADMGVLLIRFHQEVISPADGPRSHFIPSSSQYTLDAMKQHGFFTGVAMGCDRLMRENDDPWIYRTTLTPQGDLMKRDPVPN